MTDPTAPDAPKRLDTTDIALLKDTTTRVKVFNWRDVPGGERLYSLFFVDQPYTKQDAAQLGEFGKYLHAPANLYLIDVPENLLTIINQEET